MSDKREIKVRPLFRILAGLVCLAGVLPLLVDPFGIVARHRLDTFDLVGILLILPLFSYCALAGKVPDFIVRHLDDESYDDMMHTEKFFTEFGEKSISFAVVALLMVAFAIGKHYFW